MTDAPIFFRGRDTGSIFVRSGGSFIILRGYDLFVRQEGDVLRREEVMAGKGIMPIPSPIGPSAESDYERLQRFRIQHDGFEGLIIGHYKRLDGTLGVVGQQSGTNIVHVYSEKWLKP